MDQEVHARARTCARAIAELIPGTAVSVYVAGRLDGEEVWLAKASVGEVSPHSAAVPMDSGTLGELAASKAPIIFSGKELLRESYAHVDTRKTVVSLAYLPLLKRTTWIGAIEILGYETEIEEGTLDELAPFAQVAAAALQGAATYEAERNESLISLTRLSQLYDIEKIF